MKSWRGKQAHSKIVLRQTASVRVTRGRSWRMKWQRGTGAAASSRASRAHRGQETGDRAVIRNTLKTGAVTCVACKFDFSVVDSRPPSNLPAWGCLCFCRERLSRRPARWSGAGTRSLACRQPIQGGSRPSLILWNRTIAMRRRTRELSRDTCEMNSLTGRRSHPPTRRTAILARTRRGFSF